MDKPRIKIIFRVWKKSGEVIALFPEISVDHDKANVQSYENIGQHGAADYYYVVYKTKLATKEEYELLLTELTQIYDDCELVPCRKRTTEMYDNFLEGIET